MTGNMNRHEAMGTGEARALEPGLEPAARAVRRLLERKVEAGLPGFDARPLADFLEMARAHALSLAEKEVICEQAILILDQFYAHLPFKRARYAIDPVQKLRLLRSRLGEFDDLAFHSEVLQVFTELRDAHTLYGLPPPYRGALAFLPFVVRHYTGEDGVGHYIVTQLLAGFDHAEFRPGVEITQWNGMPMARAVERVAASIAAGNAAAKFARGLTRMTARTLTYSLPPAEETVFVRYRAADGERLLMLPWYVATGFPDGAFRASASAVCQPVADGAAMRGVVWSEDWDEQRALQEREEQEAADRQGMGQAPVFGSLDAIPESFRELGFLRSSLPKVFEFQHPSGLIVRRTITPDELTLGDKRFGYVRIKTFDGHADDAIVEEFRRILEVMNEYGPDGLVLDVRGNAGGSIKAAERLLQMLTPYSIEPAAFHFANTASVQKIFRQIGAMRSDDTAEEIRIRDLQADFAPWMEDSAKALAEGLQMTTGRPLTPARLANDIGQVYRGPVVLVIDAVSYSATDIFAAGFQDHEIGEIIGVDANTGGGGASRWQHHGDLFERRGLLPGMPLEPLPGGATIAFARLRSSRRGAHAGQALEDVGVARTIDYRLTRKDLMDWGSDLVRFACRHLATQPVWRLRVKRAVLAGDAIHLEIEAENLKRLVCQVNGVPQSSASGRDTTMVVPLDGLDPRRLRSVTVHGYAWRSPAPEGESVLVASTRCALPLPVEP